MQLVSSVHVVDTHAAGCPIRIITGGTPVLRGGTMLEKMLDMQQNHDWLRTLTMYEPRGHREMVGAVLTEPVDPRADVGVFYIDSGWYAPMCGAGTIALGKALVETGIVPIREPVTPVCMETPSGLVTAYATVNAGEVERVEFENVESFLYRENLHVTTREFGQLRFAIGYGGNFFAFVESEAIGLKLERDNAAAIAELGMSLLAQMRREVTVSHPQYPGITSLNDIMFTRRPREQGGETIYKNTVVFGGKQVDRSPCGTGSCARMAALYTKGELGQGESVVHESILGTRFRGRVVQARRDGGLCYVTCRLGGHAHITGFQNLVVDYHDRLKHGFQL